MNWNRVSIYVLVGLFMACSEGAKVPVEKDVWGGEDTPGQWDGTSTDAGADIPNIPSDVSDDSGLPGDSGGSGDDVGDGALEDGGGQDGIGDDSTQSDVQDPPVSVTTYASVSTVAAGVPLPFECAVEGLEEGTYATYLHIVGPANVDVANLKVTFKKVGKYKVACVCQWSEGEVEDETPLTIEVEASSAYSIDTMLSKNAVKAGENVSVTCTILDKFGNLVEVPPMVAVQPQYGLDVYGMKILALKAGTYQVACAEPISMVTDSSPETLTVSSNVPKKITTTLDSDTIIAGQSTGVTCAVEDAFGNVIPDFPLAVFLSPGLVIDGFSVSGTKAGTFQVTCVPQSDPWEYFTLDPKSLTVKPSNPTGVKLTVTPPKPVYNMFETVQFLVTAVDEYGNVVPDVELLPISWDPMDSGVIQVDPMTYKFETEGIFLFSACLADAPSICGTLELVVDGYGPVITIKFPARGATLMGKPSVTVIGNVVDPVSGVTKFSINGYPVPVDPEGDFTFPIVAEQGMNLIVAVAEDPNGFKTLLVQAFYYSPVWYKADINDPEGSKMKDSLLFFLTDEFFDDWDHNPNQPDDLSTLAEITLANLDFGSFIPNPVASSGPYKVYLGPFSYNKPVIHIHPFDSGIEVHLSITNINIGVEAKGSCKILFIDFCPDVSGKVKMNELNVYMGFDVSVNNGQPVMGLKGLQVSFDNMEVDIDGILGWLFGWLVNWIVGGYTAILEDTVAEMVAEQVQDLLGGLFTQLAINQQMELPNPLNPDAPPVTLSLATHIGELHFNGDGVVVNLDAAVLAAKNINKNPLGSIGRASCLNWVPETFDTEFLGDFALIAIHDDLINQMLFSAWWAGLLDLDVPLDDFVDLDGLGDLGFGNLQDLGISDIEVRTEFYLPPIITSCKDYEQLELQVGDMYVELNMKMLSQPVSIGMFVSLAAEAEIEVLDGPSGPELSLGIGDIDPMVAQITFISDNLAGAEGFMTMIIQGVILPMLLDSFAEQSLAAFPIPSFNISELSDMLPPNIVWQFVIDEFYRLLGYTTLEAHLEVQ